MDKATQEFMNVINTLVVFYRNIPDMLDRFHDAQEHLELIQPYVEYEIKKALKDIVHVERL